MVAKCRREWPIDRELLNKRRPWPPFCEAVDGHHHPRKARGYVCLVVLVVDPRGIHNWIVINLTAYQVVIGALYTTHKVVQLQYKVVACSALLWLVGWAALCWFSQLRWELFCNIYWVVIVGGNRPAGRQFILGLQQQLGTMNGSRWSSMVVHCGSAEVAIDGNIMTTVYGGHCRESCATPLTNIVCTILHFKRFNRRTEQGRQATLLPSSSTSIYGHDLQIGHLDSIIA